MPLPKADSVKVTGRITTNTSSPEVVAFADRKVVSMGQAEFLREAVERSYSVEEGLYYTPDQLKVVIPVILQQLNYIVRPNDSSFCEVSVSQERSSEPSGPAPSGVTIERTDAVSDSSNLVNSDSGSSDVEDLILEKLTSGKW